ncbi:MAG: hypothetical protein A2033_01950 [Bacteroidetes bacterium GWA2_31_9]|nr:MAG: hypothetical protein A2033_01950 [Bacteroidetes bacterium GWA2_31_9]
MRLFILIIFHFLLNSDYSFSQLNYENNKRLEANNNKNFSLLIGSAFVLNNNSDVKNNGIAIETSYLKFVDKNQGIGFKVHFNYFNSKNILRNSYPKNELIIKFASPVYCIRFYSDNKSYFHIFHSLGLLSYSMYYFRSFDTQIISTLHRGNTIGFLFGWGGVIYCKNNLLIPVNISILNGKLKNIMSHSYFPSKEKKSLTLVELSVGIMLND